MATYRGISPKIISAVLNKGFAEWGNTYRVEASKQTVQQGSLEEEESYSDHVNQVCAGLGVIFSYP